MKDPKWWRQNDGRRVEPLHQFVHIFLLNKFRSSLSGFCFFPCGWLWSLVDFQNRKGIERLHRCGSLKLSRSQTENLLMIWWFSQNKCCCRTLKRCWPNNCRGLKKRTRIKVCQAAVELNGGLETQRFISGRVVVRAEAWFVFSSFSHSFILFLSVRMWGRSESCAPSSAGRRSGRRWSCTTRPPRTTSKWHWWDTHTHYQLTCKFQLACGC